MNMESLTERNKAIYRRFLDEVFNQGRLDVADAMLPPSYVLHDAPPGTPTGPEAVKQVVKMFRSAFPDLKITVEDMVAEGDRVCSSHDARHPSRYDIWHTGYRQVCSHRWIDDDADRRWPYYRELGQK